MKLNKKTKFENNKINKKIEEIIKKKNKMIKNDKLKL